MLILAGTPIGRADDASPRLRELLGSAPVVAAEDTRRLKRLAADLDVQVTGRIVSYFEGNERERTPELVAALVDGDDVLLVTDAGMPSVSDPGYRLVDAALAAGVVVTAVPGPSAVLTALALSGLPVDRFTFEGFVPRKQGERLRALQSLADERRTMVFFESPHRTRTTLAAMAQVLGHDRPAALCRELTKTYEEVVRDGLAALVDWVDAQEHGVRGEVTLVVAGAEDPAVELDADAIRARVRAVEAEGASRKDAIAQVVAETGLRKRVVYEAAHS
ncbi:16S rRNA (cytidine(1402)-2'-O)-methyltransferase [Aeromicrobium halocynthiae]|uniref:Ribosomal RNA small subunit methyltransferase I n=1 Tax=Aeromicrobium halocynthiae TaxID=560557 RepID=A0ABN2VYW2_9ACTN